MITITALNTVHSVAIAGKNKTTYRPADLKSMVYDPLKGALIIDQQDRAYFIPNSNITQVSLESPDAFDGKNAKLAKPV
jgi:hypothetical protein